MEEIRNSDGFTLVELIVAGAIFIVVFLGILMSFIRCIELSELSRNSSRAVAAVTSRFEQLAIIPRSQILATFHNSTFTVPDLTGIGVGHVDATNAELLEVTASFCWRQKNGLVIGEDKNLDGQLNAGEDTNGNGIIDSPVTITTVVYNE